MYDERVIEMLGHRLHLLDNGVESPDLVLVFPPGAEDARFIRYLDYDLLKKSRTICVSYPSRYKSGSLSNYDSIANIASILGALIRMLLLEQEYRSVHLIGFSFGTAVVTTILQTEVFLDVSTDAVLVNPGEFIPKPAKPLLQAIFAPAIRFERYARFLRYIVTRVLHLYRPAQMPKGRLVDIGEQFLSTLDYKLDISRPVSAPAKLICAQTDIVIDRGSVEKLHKVYVNAEFLDYPGGHLLSYDEGSSDFEQVDNILRRILI